MCNNITSFTFYRTLFLFTIVFPIILLFCNILRFLDLDILYCEASLTEQRSQISPCTQVHNDNKGFQIVKLESNPQPWAGIMIYAPAVFSLLLLALRKLPVRLVLRGTPASLHFHPGLLWRGSSIHGSTFERRLFDPHLVDVLLKGTPLSFLISCCFFLTCASAYQTPLAVERNAGWGIIISLMVFCEGNKKGIIFIPLKKKKQIHQYQTSFQSTHQ